MKFQIALLILLASHVSYGQSAAFTYQGKLTDAGNPASGSYDLEFRLFTAQSGGSQIGSEQLKDNVAVSSGIFTVSLDFGSSPFTSVSANYLEISVRPGSSTGAFTLLTPRQPITSSPYAVQTIRAAAADALSASCNPCVTNSQIVSIDGIKVFGAVDNAAAAIVANVASNALQLGGVDAAQYVQTDDSRLSNARPPTAGSANYIQNGTGVQPLSNFNISGNGRVAGNLTAGALIANGVSGSAFFFSDGDRAVAAPCFHCTAVGANTGTPTGSLNSFFGRGSGMNTTTGFANSFFGSGNPIGNPQTGSGLKNTSGSFNSFFGHRAGENNTIGSVNSFFGTGAGLANVDGGSNTFIGHDAGNSNVNGSANTIVGENADVALPGLSNASAFGARAFVSSPNSLVLGSVGGFNGASSTPNVGIGVTAPQFPFHVVDAGNGGIRVETNTAGGRVASFGHRGDFLIDRPGTGPTAIQGGRFSVLENGAVGVGTGAPNFKFHVRADGQDGIKIQHTGVNDYAQIRWTDSSDVFKASIGVGPVGSEGIHLFVNGADRMIIEPNGLIRIPGGIFITNPNTLVITSGNGACWGLTVSNAGVVGAFSTPCP